MIQQIIAAVNRLTQAEPADIQLLQNAESEGIVRIERAIGVKGDANYSIIITGDNNEIVQKIYLDSEALFAYFQTPYNPPVIENIKKPESPKGVPPGSRMHFSQNKTFTGREEIMLKLANTIFDHSGATVITQSITGIGGIGKTQLAVEFCYRYGRYFHGVHWIDAKAIEVDEDTVASIPLINKINAEIAACGATMMLPGWSNEQPSQVLQTLAAWAQDGIRLIILDNLESEEDAQEILQLLNVGRDLRILITARKQEWSRNLVNEICPLDQFAPKESLAFLRKLLTDEQRYSDQEIKKLSKRLGHLPLALELAGSYLARTRISITGYLEQLQNSFQHPSMDNWKHLKTNPTEHDRSLRATFLVSWQGVEPKDAQIVFRRFSWCAPNTPISRAILQAAAELEEAELAEALIELEDVGLITYQSGEIEPLLHPLVGEFGQVESLQAVELVDLEKVADVFVRASNTAIDTGYPREFKPIRKHMEFIAGHAQEHELEDTGTLWNNFGYHLSMIADYAGARQIYERALAIDEEIFGPEHPKVGIRVNNLGSVLNALGDYAGARQMFERALAIDEETFGPEHPNVSRGLNNLGSVLQTMGDYEGARQMFERALAIFEKTFGPEHPKVATSVNSLGGVLNELGDYAGARQMFERALAIHEETFGLEHPNVARMVNNLGSVLNALGDYEGARQMYERALAIDEETFGPEHPNVGIRVNNLGYVLQDMGNYAGARQMFERALAIFELHLGKDHPNVATLVNNLGSVLNALGDYARARQMYERALAIDEETFGPEHPSVGRDVNNLGGVLNAFGDYAGARQMYVRALAILELHLGKDHPNTRIIRGNLESLDQ